MDVGSPSRALRVRAAVESDGAWVTRLLEARWGATVVARLGDVVDASALPALLAVGADGRPCGLATYRRGSDDTELVTLDAEPTGCGAGSALVNALARQEARAGARRLWLVTTNDNLDALRFYQRRGFRLVALHPGAVAVARRLKPSISAVGQHGIPIRDELELVLELAADGPQAVPP